MTFYAYFGEETICMSCKTFFSGKITKNITGVLGFSYLYNKKKKKKKISTFIQTVSHEDNLLKMSQPVFLEK